MSRPFVVTPADRNRSRAEAAFDALPEWKRLSLAKAVFLVLEYDEDGNPGSEWSSDTTQALGELFERYGIVFTVPETEDLTGRTLYDDPENDPGWS